MTDQKTRRVFHFAEVLEGEAHEPNGEGYKCWREPKTGNSYAYSAGAGILHPEWMPVNRRPETTEQAPPAPKPRKRVVFEECLLSHWDCDSNGHYWAIGDGGEIACRAFTSDEELLTERDFSPVNRTEEVITEEPPKPSVWRGMVLPPDEYGYYVRASINDRDIEFSGASFDSVAEAEADIPRLKAIAETYAAQHGAVIEWEDAK